MALLGVIGTPDESNAVILMVNVEAVPGLSSTDGGENNTCSALGVGVAVGVEVPVAVAVGLGFGPELL
ncbi:MAG TPA: hypothetical protein VMH37_18310, partial [Candidatus Binataceae bacterium]|nr:hypothetical protein [Candidatus Binataceae bacterium]